VSARKSEGIGNRSLNIEIGVLRKILKRWKLWGALSKHYRALPEPKDIGKALSPATATLQQQGFKLGNFPFM